MENRGYTSNGLKHILKTKQAEYALQELQDILFHQNQSAGCISARSVLKSLTKIQDLSLPCLTKYVERIYLAKKKFGLQVPGGITVLLSFEVAYVVKLKSCDYSHTHYVVFTAIILHVIKKLKT